MAETACFGAILKRDVPSVEEQKKVESAKIIESKEKVTIKAKEAAVLTSTTTPSVR